MESTVDMLADLERMNEELVNATKRLGQVPNKIVPEPENTLGESSASGYASPKMSATKMPLTYNAEAVAAERLQRDLLKNAQNTEGDDSDSELTDEPQTDDGHHSVDTADVPTTMEPFSVSGDSQIEQLNLLSAQEFLSTYSTLVNHLSIEGFEWKNGEAEKALKKERTFKRRYLEENAVSVEEKSSVLQRIEEINQMLEKHVEAREKLDESARLTPEKQQQAATLLSEIWKIKGVEVSPYWALALIVCAPLLNAILIIFLDGNRLKLEGQ